MTISTRRFRQSVRERVLGHLKHVARDFDRKAMNPPRELAVNIPVDIPEGWIGVGYVPTPKTRLGWFTFHMVHGLAMRYPLRSVVAFSLLNMDRGHDGSAQN